MKQPELPAWIGKLTGRLAGAFFLDAWRIGAHPDWDGKPEGNETASGLASFNTNYLHADLYFDPNLEIDAEGLETVAHEVLHLVCHEVRDAVAHIIKFAPPEQQFKLQELYDLKEERLVTVLARGMVESFDMKAWLEEPADQVHTGDDGAV